MEITRKKKLSEQIQEESQETVTKDDGGASRPLIPTGSTMLNLAMSDSIQGGCASGTMINIIGDSAAGKSLLALTILAEVYYGQKDI